jgi:death-on-curing protein
MTRYLSQEEVLALYRNHIGAPALRDSGAFLSALALSRSYAAEEDAPVAIVLKAAALLHSLMQEKPFVDGNERIAWIAANVFLDLNGYELEVGPAQIDHLFRVSIIEEQWSIAQIGEWLASYLIRVPSKEH